MTYTVLYNPPQKTLEPNKYLVIFGGVYFQFVSTTAQSVMRRLEQIANYRQQKNSKPIHLTHLGMFNLTARQH